MEPGLLPLPISASLFAFLIAVILFFLFFELVTISFTKLGIPRWLTIVIFAASLVGSVMNIPVYREQVTTGESGFFQSRRVIYHRPPVTPEEKIIAVNVGGAVIPVALSIYLMQHAPLARTILATGAMTALTYFLAQPVSGVGIEIPVFVPPIAAAVLAVVLTGHWRGAAPLAYISGVLGTLIGADLLHIGDVGGAAGQVLSIGGAGVFDGIFLVGVVAAFLA